jgi:hypothetical protein
MYVKDSLPSSQEPANVQYFDVLCVQEPSLLRHYTLSIDKQLPAFEMVAVCLSARSAGSRIDCWAQLPNFSNYLSIDSEYHSRTTPFWEALKFRFRHIMNLKLILYLYAV